MQLFAQPFIPDNANLLKTPYIYKFKIVVPIVIT